MRWLVLLVFMLVGCGEENPYSKDDDGDGYSEFDGDCNDNDGEIFPNATELCDQFDNNCNNEIDEGVLIISYIDFDGDGFGNITYPSEDCEIPDGYTNNSDDCDDINPLIYPAAEEICDGIINDCININEGKIDWKYKDRAFAYASSPAVSKDRVVVGCRDKRLHCLDRNTGKRIWVFRTRGKVDSSPVIADGKVIVGSDDGNLYVVSLDDGKKLWSYEIGEPVIAAPAIANGTIVIGAEDGRVYAFGSN